MRAVIQRVSNAEITIDYKEKREISSGLVVFICIMKGDTEKQAEFLAEKICNLRIFKDESDKLNLSLKTLAGDMLIVSNFTLSTDCGHGRRPNFDNSAPFEEANRLYNYFIECVKKQEIGSIKTGEFATHMDVMVNNDGPINIFIDTQTLGK